jgi:hypothetical protein
MGESCLDSISVQVAGFTLFAGMKHKLLLSFVRSIPFLELFRSNLKSALLFVMHFSW